MGHGSHGMSFGHGPAYLAGGREREINACWDEKRLNRPILRTLLMALLPSAMLHKP
jgi:hypothetical protein